MEKLTRRQFLQSAAVHATGLAATGLLVGCATSESAGPPPHVQTAPEGETALPEPRLESEMSLEEAIARRRSVREFTDEPLSFDEISQLLWAAQGITDPRGLRSAPSAGALYPLELYVATAEGAYHYLPRGHALQVVWEEDRRPDLWEAGLKQSALQEAPAILVVTAVYQRAETKYGERAERYVKLEAGHAAQNILLQAVALELGAVPIGAFYDDQVQDALSLPADHRPLYLIPVGYPRT
ncbi:MAG: nitroreductase [Chloroflexi bacterium B3_Chlor]|nr:MAG: nitroreductase [Chloroflexi bacterium B3_Chlor]